jgi:NAD(P)H-hydrate epimerase
MIGAPALSAMGATRAGCGLVKVATPEPILNAVLSLCPNATGYPIQSNHIPVFDRLANEADSIVIGPGLGTSEEVLALVEHAMWLPADSKCQSLVIDADALNALAQLSTSNPKFTTPTVLTPHPGEAARLLEAFGFNANPTGDADDRLIACRALAQHFGCVVVLKGSGSVVCDSNRAWICSNGHPCLGTGGTGDVLSGMIASLGAQSANSKELDLFYTTCIAVDAHAQSGKDWANRHRVSAGLNPWDLETHIPQAIEIHRELGL